jgi:FxsC-like protein
METSEIIETVSPDVAELAKVVSLAIRVEPYLLRAARLELLPHLSAGTEADLWFSPLVESRSPLGLVLAQGVAEELRRELAKDRALLAGAWRITREAHRDSHPTIRLEERLIRLALAGRDEESEREPSDEIEELLLQALAALAVGTDALGIARWAARALPRMPDVARDSDTAEALALGAGARLDGYRILEKEFPTEGALEKLRWVLPSEKSITVGVRLLDNGVEFSEPPAAGAHRLEVPGTNPLLFELFDVAGADTVTEEFAEGSAADTTPRAVEVSLSPGETRFRPVAFEEIRLRTARGRTYALRRVATEPEPTAPPAYWFYFSYAGRDQRNVPYLREFYNDLVQEVRKLAGITSSASDAQIGFFDEVGIETGDRWADRVAEALNSCRTFVCLLSASYLDSEFCGKEFQVFLERLDRYAATSSKGRPTLILPVLWASQKSLPSPLPPVVASIRIFSTDDPEIYREQGLEGLLRMKSGREYREFLSRFASTLVKHAESDKLPPLDTLPRIEEVESAFLNPESAGETGGSPDNVYFVFVAGSRTEMQKLRRHVEAYGDVGGAEWQPFLPEGSRHIGFLTQSVATEAELYSNILPVEQDLINRLRAAESRNTLVIVVVDPWALLIPRYRSIMEELDRMNFVNCAVLILWNESDDETTQNREQLQATVKRVFAHWGVMYQAERFREHIRSEDELRGQLNETLQRIVRELVERHSRYRKIEGGSTEIPGQ